MADPLAESALVDKLGYRVRGHHIEFIDYDRLKRNELGTARSGARPATPQEIQMWDLLISLTQTATDETADQ